MKLDDFLKCKKVRCVEGNYSHGLIRDKVYDVISTDYNEFFGKLFIKIDKNGIGTSYLSDFFEPVLDSAENPLQNIELMPEFEAVEPVLVDNCQVNIQDIGTDILDTNADIKDTPKFKVGDRVYVGLTGKIETVEYFDIRENEMITQADEVFNAKKCCHATTENYERLQATFTDIEFEQPPKPLSGDALVKAMLAKGIKNVLCLWGNGDKIIIDRLDYKGSLMSADCRVVGGLTPIDWVTDEPLTESVLID